MNKQIAKKAVDLLEGLALEPNVNLDELREVILELKKETKMTIEEAEKYLTDLLAHNVPEEEDPTTMYQKAIDFYKEYGSELEDMYMIKHSNPYTESVSIIFKNPKNIRIFTIGDGFSSAYVSDYDPYQMASLFELFHQFIGEYSEEFGDLV